MAGKDITTLPKWAIGTTRSRWEATQRRRRSTCRIHLVFSNLKTWINGTHHGRIEPRHLQAYLNEFVFRFNRRFYPMHSFNSGFGISARTVPPTYAQLYSGEWTHAA